jgi:striatin 1/3/4
MLISIFFGVDVALPNEARLSIGSMPNGTSAANKGSQQPAKESTGWNSGVNSANLALGKAPPGRDARSRARSRDYLKQCLLEVTYLTSHQAMNPLPNRTLLNAGNNNLAPGMQTNSSQTNLPLQAGLAIPNLPNFEGNAGLNGRAKKGGPDINNKDFPLANGNTSADRNDKPPTFLGVNNFPGGGPVSGALVPPTDGRPGDNIAQIITNPLSRDSGHSSEDEPTQLTAIFRPDDAGEWRERLRVANQEAVMRQNMTGQFTNMPDSGSSYTSQTLGTSGWDLSLGSEDSNAVIGAHADDEEDEGSSLVGDDSGKKWKVRKTLRK